MPWWSQKPKVAFIIVLSQFRTITSLHRHAWLFLARSNQKQVSTKDRLKDRSFCSLPQNSDSPKIPKLLTTFDSTCFSNSRRFFIISGLISSITTSVDVLHLWDVIWFENHLFRSLDQISDSTQTPKCVAKLVSARDTTYSPSVTTFLVWIDDHLIVEKFKFLKAMILFPALDIY